MSRSRYKFIYISFFHWKNIYLPIKFRRWKKFRNHYIYSKNSAIPACYLNTFVLIHKGYIFKKLFIDSRMISKKFGLFILTRKPFFFPLKEKKKK